VQMQTRGREHLEEIVGALEQHGFVVEDEH
jgi:hypothetical protein